MKLLPTGLADCFIIEPDIFTDNRGYFFESFNESTFSKLAGFSVHFVQDNQSYSKYGVLRGLHFQNGEHAQAKLVQVVKGEVLDVAVDLRPNSPTYGRHTSIRLSEENKTMFFVPRGFAHGFAVLSDEAVFQYKCDNFYNKESESGIHYADPFLAIDWTLPADDLIISDKDRELPFLSGQKNNIYKERGNEFAENVSRQFINNTVNS
ncbi:MAG TPA: dTDP-4-dehydrorhamnose 3,5-epimerase [Pyrinomonadaceae bacterium]|jgi:dTDP-4-dehydrorhamnose 3,5-epimerase|nr:dTDP-4-dehydrorhamnose 3,5-epimerase [Pyrinomonadaceae bacterium]